MTNNQWERFQAVADELEDAVRTHLERESGPLEVTPDDIAEFVHSRDREQVYDRLAEHRDLMTAAKLISGETEAQNALMFWALRVRTNKNASWNPMFDDEPTETELRAVLALLDSLIERAEAPPLLDPDDVELVVGRPPRYFEAVSKSKDWLEESDTDSFFALWPIVPESYDDVCKTLIQQSDEVSFVLGKGVVDTYESEGQEWLLPLLQEQNQFDVYVAPGDFDCFLFLLDDCVIMGINQHFSSSWTGAALKTDDPEFYRWASEIFAGYRDQSEQLSWSQAGIQ